MASIPCFYPSAVLFTPAKVATNTIAFNCYYFFIMLLLIGGVFETIINLASF